MASENFTDKNVVFRKLKAKSENKVCVFAVDLEIVLYIWIWNL
jgi:hypothetical protein